MLRCQVRGEAGKRTQPTAAILDSQTVRSSDHAGERGYDGAKKTKGRKRHILVDTLGLLLWVCVTPADVAERDGARTLLDPALRWFRWLRCVWADQGFTGEEFAAVGGGPPQNWHVALGGRPPTPEPARLRRAGQALDRGADVRLVYEASAAGARLRNQDRTRPGLALYRHDWDHAPAVSLKPIS